MEDMTVNIKLSDVVRSEAEDIMVGVKLSDLIELNARATRSEMHANDAEEYRQELFIARNRLHELELDHERLIITQQQLDAAQNRVCSLDSENARLRAKAQEMRPGRLEGNYSIFLRSYDCDKISAIKAVRQALTLGLKEAKDLVEFAPITIVAGVNREWANYTCSELSAAGLVVNVEVTE